MYDVDIINLFTCVFKLEIDACLSKYVKITYVEIFKNVSIFFKLYF